MCILQLKLYIWVKELIISKMNQTLKDMNKKMKNMEDRINKLERFFSSYGLKLPENVNKP